MSRLVAALAWVWLALLGAPASAHEISMAELQLRETARGEFIWQWTSGLYNQGGEVRPVWPAPCREEAQRLSCGPQGLVGPVAVDGVGKRYSAVLLRVHWLDGQSTVHTLTASQPQARLFGSAEDGRGGGEIAGAYFVLGIEHILAGIDHLLFVLALLALVGFRRGLIGTVTAFTLAHSITLVLGALGLLTLRPPPVEATIALSIVLVAREALHEQPTLSRRWPALVAFLFGLVHGLGFAGALEQIGLPQNHLPLALLTFNLGVEAGQLLVLLLAWGLVTLLRRWPARRQARTAMLYATGSLAVYWTLSRIAAL